ncbi:MULTISPECIES: nitrous oxide reductase family maturation protein NosD [Methanobrevibacter]|uniref:Parallel beta-helix repeat protein n=1 Tax=Methanobrevibacter gottschalkii DSM 11977 TaxID=1122229 RepID=A0A3N5AYS8_9EURY|nr:MULTISPECIES: hypothetical protein [Methanobrevibacter]OEC94292.1 hypothetical protein A9505_08850 [Methanobrevibacter sp. A27]RPF50416.1 hypothetical protein EDC42_1693 [Methanobrevibacter gottschalkii DSM 11977]
MLQAKKTITVTVKSIPTSLTVNDLTCNYGEDNSYLYATLKDTKNNKFLNGQTITFKINDKIINVVSDNKGRAKIKIDEKPGLYNVIVSFTKSPYASISKKINVNVISFNPTVNYDGGFYNKSYLNLSLNINNAKLIKYCLNNDSWSQSDKSVSFILTNGIYDLYYSNGSGSIFHEHYLIDNNCPVVWSNFGSDLYDSSIIVNLSSWDNLDANPKIYYSLDESNFKLYENLLNISRTTLLKFYSIDFNGHKSETKTCNYIFEKIGNLNSGRGFTTIQSAIDDSNTHNGDIIKISEGLYNEPLTVNKFVTMIGINATLTSRDPSRPVIGITGGGSNSVIYGFKIKDSEHGVVIYHADNVSVINNQFINVVKSIEIDDDKNTLVAYNSIDSDKFLNFMSGVAIRKSDNLMVFNNNISLNSDTGAGGIVVTNITSNNISIVNNRITNKNNLNGIGLYVICSNVSIDSNNVSNFNAGLYVVSSNSHVTHNEFKNNNHGVFLRVSVNNTYAFNNIHDNILCGFVLDTSLLSYNDSCYLNRLCDNSQYDFYSEANSDYVINDNWWGENTPKISINRSILANIYNATGNVIMNSWMVAHLFSSSYKINENNNIERAKFYVDLTYNNIGNDLSYKGYIPNNLKSFIGVFNGDGAKKSNISYLHEGKSFVDFELNDLFKNHENITVMSIFDNVKILNSFNKKVTIDIMLFSSAWDFENNYFVNKTYQIPFSNNASWITFCWSETGLFTGKIYVIVNGEILDEINIHNLFYQKFKNNYSTNVFEAIKLLDTVFASTKEGVWAPNGYYFSFAKAANIDFRDYNSVYNRFLNYIKLYYDLTDSDLNFVKNYKGFFIDFIDMTIDFHGDMTPDINFDYNGVHKLLKPPSSYAHRISNIYYTDIEDENNISIGYEGMRSFAIVKDNLTNDDLQFWLNQKELYAPGLMKAAYGTFLTSLLVIYENDRVADESAIKFNVTWSRISPVCVSLCNDYNCLYVTGESDHGMGREAIGNISDVWKFNFATSFSFSLVEQLVGNNIWNDTTIGSVTLGLIESYFNNETMEIFTSNGYIFIKCENDGNTLLFLDLKTGIVRDYFSYYGLLGTMPCYHDNITENAWKYGNNLLNNMGREFNDLKNIFGIGVISATLIGEVEFIGLEMSGIGSALIEGSEIGLLFGEISIAPIMLISLPIIMFLFPEQVNEVWMNFASLFNPYYKDYPDIPIYENTYPANIINPPKLVLDGKSSDDYIISQLKNNRNFNNKYKRYNSNVNKDNINFKIKIGPIPSGKGPKDMDNLGSAEEVGKYLKELYKNYKDAKSKGEVLKFVKSNIKELFALSLYFESIETVNLLINLFLYEIEKDKG